MIELKVAKTHEDAIIPQYQTKGSACFDLHCINGGVLDKNNPTLKLRTGLAFDIPDGFVMLIHSRSSQGFKYDVRLCNSTGVIDSDYVLEVQCKLTLDNLENTVIVEKGDRICQAMLIELPKINLVEVDSINKEVERVGGIGSTGK